MKAYENKSSSFFDNTVTLYTIGLQQYPADREYLTEDMEQTVRDVVVLVCEKNKIPPFVYPEIPDVGHVRNCRKITHASWLVYFSDCTGQKASM